jgi:hypothetical protein
MVWNMVKGLSSLNVVLILKLPVVQQITKIPTSYETHVHRSAVLNHILGQLNSVNTLTPYTLGFQSGIFPFSFPNKMYKSISDRFISVGGRQRSSDC